MILNLNKGNKGTISEYLTKTKLAGNKVDVIIIPKDDFVLLFCKSATGKINCALVKRVIPGNVDLTFLLMYKTKQII